MVVFVCVFKEDPKKGMDWLKKVRVIRETQKSGDWEIDCETLNQNKPSVDKVVFRYGKRVILIGDFVNATATDEAGGNEGDKSIIEVENVHIQGAELKQFDKESVMKIKSCGVVNID